MTLRDMWPGCAAPMGHKKSLKQKDEGLGSRAEKLGTEPSALFLVVQSAGLVMDRAWRGRGGGSKRSYP